MPEYALAEGTPEGDVVIHAGQHSPIVIPEGETFSTSDPEVAAILEEQAITEKVSDDPPVEGLAEDEPLVDQPPIPAPDQPVDQGPDPDNPFVEDEEV